MDIIISNSSGKPIYEQITSQIKNLVITGELKPGDPLPSIRVLAKELRISVITTKRAYEDLERDGFIVSVPGKGTFVADQSIEMLRERQLKIVEEHLQTGVDAAKMAEISLDELVEMLGILYGEEE